MLDGIIIDGQKHQFTDVVEGEKVGSNQWFSVCLVSGKNREVRKIFQSLDLEVSRLKRTRFGPIFLPSTLKKGKTIDHDHGHGHSHSHEHVHAKYPHADHQHGPQSARKSPKT